LTPSALAALIDHTLLRAGATQEETRRHCLEALEHGFRAVCLFPSHLETAAETLRGSPVILASVVSYPHGASTLLGKVFEALEAFKLGAGELDIVMNLSAIGSGQRSVIEEEVRTLMDRTRECRHKFILETGLWREAQIDPVLAVMNQRRPAFVKTSTGVNAPGATPGAVSRLRAALHPSIGVKASGGIRSLAQAEALVAAGATCLGTSAGVDLLRQATGLR
jgi:deoxyribose-phosphate aldolase